MSTEITSVLQKYIENIISDEEFNLFKDDYSYNKPKTKEEYFYRKIFDKYYPEMETVLPPISNRAENDTYKP